MTPDEIEILRQSVDRTVKFRCSDGEVVIAKIDSVDVADEEVVYEMLSTTDQSKYEKFDRQPAYLMHFREIASVEILPDSSAPSDI